jgi:tRNA(Ile2) C34 agmatinyltransferase TiaS
MSKLYTIQLGVPICPECGGGLKLYTIANKFRCFHCGEAYKVVGFGQNEREFICEKANRDGKVQSSNEE